MSSKLNQENQSQQKLRIQREGSRLISICENTRIDLQGGGTGVWNFLHFARDAGSQEFIIHSRTFPEGRPSFAYAAEAQTCPVTGDLLLKLGSQAPSLTYQATSSPHRPTAASTSRAF